MTNLVYLIQLASGQYWTPRGNGPHTPSMAYAGDFPSLAKASWAASILSQAGRGHYEAVSVPRRELVSTIVEANNAGRL